MKTLRAILLMLLLASGQEGKAQGQVDDLIPRGIDYRVYDLPAETRSVSSFTPVTTELVSYTADGKVYLASAGSRDHRLMYRAAAAGITGVTPFTGVKDTCLVLSLVTPRKAYLTRSDVLPMDTASAIAVLPSGIYELQSYQGKALFAYGVTRKNSRGVVWKYDPDGPSVQFAGNSPVTGLVLISDNELYVTSGNALYHIKQGAPKPTLIKKWDEPVTGFTYDAEMGWFISLTSQIVRYRSLDEQGETLARQINGPLAIREGRLFTLWREKKKIIQLLIRNQQISNDKEGPSQNTAKLAIDLAQFFANYRDADLIVDRAIYQAERISEATPETRFLSAKYKFNSIIHEQSSIINNISVLDTTTYHYLYKKWNELDSIVEMYHKINNYENHKYDNTISEIDNIIAWNLENMNLIQGSINYKNYIKYKTNYLLKTHRFNTLDSIYSRDSEIDILNEYQTITKEFVSSLDDIRESYLKTWKEIKRNKSNASLYLANLHIQNVISATNTFSSEAINIGSEAISGALAGVELVAGIFNLIKQGIENKNKVKDYTEENRYIHANFVLKVIAVYQNRIGELVTGKTKKVSNIIHILKQDIPLITPSEEKNTNLKEVYYFVVIPLRNYVVISSPFKINRNNDGNWSDHYLLDHLLNNNEVFTIKYPPVTKASLQIEDILPKNIGSLKISNLGYYEDKNINGFQNIMTFNISDNKKPKIGNYYINSNPELSHLMGYFFSENEAELIINKIEKICKSQSIGVYKLKLSK